MVWSRRCCLVGSIVTMQNMEQQSTSLEFPMGYVYIAIPIAACDALRNPPPRLDDLAQARSPCSSGTAAGRLRGRDFARHSGLGFLHLLILGVPIAFAIVRRRSSRYCSTPRHSRW